MLARRSCQTWSVPDRRERLDAARLYLICDARTDQFLVDALGGGVDIVQLRMKDAADAEIIAAGRRFARACAAHRALLIINDRPDLVRRAHADGVHVGQDDVSTGRARELVGPDRLVGLSTHARRQVDSAGTDVDYIGVGPVHATPTKPGRPAVGIGLVEYASSHTTTQFFAIGGIDRDNVDEVVHAGAQRIAVMRAVTQADDPKRAARELRAAIVGEVGVGPT